MKMRELKREVTPGRPRRLRAAARFLHIVLVCGSAYGTYLRERIRLRGNGVDGRQRAAGRALLRLCTRLGATFIKVGQIVSTRSDLLPQLLLDELAAVQDHVPPFPFAVVERTIEAELGRPLEEVFDRFDQAPVAAGSVAQVHRAVLRSTGDDVAVKVRRPDVAKKMVLDRAILRFGARMLERLLPSFRMISAEEAVTEFCAAVERQLDFVAEARSNARITEMARQEGDDWVLPRTFAEASSAAVLTMEWVDGLREHELPGSGVDVRRIVRVVVRGVCRSIFVHGFLHADPHPGNIRFLSPGRMVLMDFGLVGELGDDDRRVIGRMVLALASGDGKGLAKVLYDQAPRRAVLDYRAYEAEMATFAADVSPRALRDLDTIRHVGRMFDILRRHHVQARSNLTMVYVALLAMEGLAKRLAPDMVFFREVLPYVAEGLGLLPRGSSSAGTSSPPARAKILEETSFAAGRYRVLRLLGEGARKRVHLARDLTLEREVAISVLKGEADARLAIEARAMAALSDHPRIVAVYDFGNENGRPYIVSEYLAGGTVEELLERREARGLPVADALRIAGQICQGLAHAHSRGMVHRDVKPANVWLTAEGFAKLGDFGLATEGEEPQGSDPAIVGTVTYMSPEQALGKPIEPRSDLYSLGCMLHEMLTGEPPFAGNAAAVLAHHLQTEPAPPSAKNPALPQALDAIVLGCLAKDPRDRPESAAALERRLAEVAAASDSGAPAASPHERLESAVFVGREQELAQLVSALDQALAGRGRISLLAGEPGIGKTRTASELAVHARRRGARVLVGRCHEGEGAPVFWPWVQVIRAYAQECEPRALVTEMGLAAAEIAQLVPEIHERIPGLPTAPSGAGEDARFRLFDGITSFFKRAAKSRPLVLVLDDLHWADKSSLLLLQFLARQIEDARLHVIATYRDVEVQQGHPLAEVLPALRRVHGLDRIRLRGLGEADVRAILAARGGRDVSSSVTRAIHSGTEGNPFFVEEIASHLAEEGKLRVGASPEEIGIPESVRDVISRRIGRLSESCRRALSLASVIGREFDLSILKRVANGEGESLEAALGDAIEAGVVSEVPRAGGRLRFSHALIRETLYGDLRTAQRLALHKRTGEALEEIHGEASDRHLAELAYHYTEAASLGEIDKAVRYATRAGDQAAGQLAFEEAVRHFEHALESLDLAESSDPRQRCEILLKLGEALFSAGEGDRSEEVFLDAAGRAESAGDAERLARAALGYGGGHYVMWNSLSPNPTRRALLEKALASLPVEDSALRARLMVRFAVAQATAVWMGNSPAEEAPRGVAMALEAVAMARRVGDAEGLAGVLLAAVWAIQSPDNLEERIDLVSEAMALGRQAGAAGARLEGLAHLCLSQFKLETGDLDGADAEEAAFQLFPQASRESYGRWLTLAMRATRATFEGRFSDAEKAIAEALAVGEQTGDSDKLANATGQLVWLRILQGKSTEETGELVSLLQRLPGLAYVRVLELGASFRTTLLRWELTHQERVQVRRVFEALGGRRFADVPRGPLWMTDMAGYAEVAGILGDREAAAELLELLSPFAERCITQMRFVLASPVSRSLGFLAATLARFEEAESYFEHALVMSARMRSPVYIALTQVSYAQMLRRRGASGDRERALALLNEAIESYRKRGDAALLEAAIALKLEVEGIAAHDAKSSIHAVASSVDARRPDLAAQAAPDGTVTILFSDVAGFSAMTERLGDRRAHEIMSEHNAIVRRELAFHDGHEVELRGDGFMLVFASARKALGCAVAIQKRFEDYCERHPEEPIRVRMGLHAGEVIRDAKSFFGKSVIQAARIAEKARGGEILVSALLRDLTESAKEFVFGAVRELELKGLAGRHGVCAVGWEGHEPVDVPEAPTAATPPSAADGNVFRKAGDFWTIEYGGKSFSMRDAKGLSYIARLLAAPGREIHSLDLIGGDGASRPSRADGEIAADLGSAGEVLDPQARAEYKARLDDLRSELEEAEQANDSGRSARLRHEIEFLTRELSAAFGLGGRARKSGDAVERARKSVHGRITESLGRIRKEHPALALHLDNAMSLGAFCEYRPEKPTSWSL